MSASTFTSLPALDLPRRTRAATVHLLVSIGIAVLSAALLLGLWYPGSFGELSGGRELFALVVTIDVILGPLLTFLIFDIRKGWPHIRRDLVVIAVVQLAALLYGIYAVHSARPVAIVFEGDRFRVVTANDVHQADLAHPSSRYQALPLTGPLLLGLRTIREGEELDEAILLEMQGVAFGARPRFWQPYDESRAAVIRAARPINVLIARYPELADPVSRLLERETQAGDARFLPVIARGDWVAVIGAEGSIIGYIYANGFF
jgi:hypothetical protein